MDNFVFKKIQLICRRQMTQFLKKKRQTSHEKKDSSVRHFSYQLTREIPKTKGKKLDKMCLLIFLKIYPQQQKQ